MSEGPKDSDFGARLWRSAHAESPSDEVRARALAAALSAGAGGGGGGGNSNAPPSPNAAIGAKGAALGWKLALGIALVAGGVVLFVTTRPAEHHGSPASLPVASAVPSPSASASPIVEARSMPSGEAAEAPSAEPSANAPRAASAPPPPPPPPSSAPRALTLADEVVAIDAARAVLARGDARAALRALDGYDKTFPRGTLAPEAEALRIEALAASGDRAGAAARANAFLSAHPSSPLAARVRRALVAPDAGSP